MLAIVLSRRDFREYDQIISLYTLEHGKKEALARGIKKITSKNSGSLEPFSVVEVDIVPGKEIDHITTTQTVEMHKHIWQDFSKLTLAQASLKLVDTLVAVGERDEKIFYLLSEWLANVNNTPLVNAFALDAFALRLASHLGFAPNLEICAKCGISTAKIPSPIRRGTEGEVRSFTFNIPAGAITCSACQTAPTAPHTIILNPQILTTLQSFITASWNTIFSLTLDKKDCVTLHNLVYQFVVFHTGKEMGDWRMLE